MNALGTIEDCRPPISTGFTAHNLCRCGRACGSAAVRRPFRRTRPGAVVLRRVGRGCSKPAIDTDREGGTPRARAGQSRPRPGEHAGHAFDLYRPAVDPAARDRADHRHSPSAVRFVVEGEGGFTIVRGENCRCIAAISFSRRRGCGTNTATKAPAGDLARCA